MTDVGTGPAAELRTVDSASWPDARMSASVLVTSWNRAHLLGDLLDAFETQRQSEGGFEVIVVDNGSDDGTFDVLSEFAARTELAARVIRLERNIGPGPARNVAADAARGTWLLVTDDDCVPDTGWVDEMVAALTASAEVDLVQGRVRPVEAEMSTAGPWDHTMRVDGPTPWFQTCNIGYRASAFRAVGGFLEDDPLVSGASRRAFGEDTMLGVSIVTTRNRRGFAPDAIVQHRVMPSSFLAQVRDRRNAVGMPGLARNPVVREALLNGVFLGRNTRRFDVALVGVVAALATRQPVALVAALPWARARWRVARREQGGTHRRLLALAGWFVVDWVVAASLVEGSIRHRCVMV